MSITFYSLSTSSGLASIDLIQEVLDEESREEIKGKMKQLESKLKKEREFNQAMLANYADETVWDMEETRYRMVLYQYKQKIWQCKILLAHNGSIQILKAIPPSFASSVKSAACPTQCPGQVPPQGTREMGQHSTAERDAAQVDVLAAVQQIIQSHPPTSCATSGSISLKDSDEASVAGTQGG